MRACVRERVCALSHASARVWVTLRTRARAPHARQILRSRDESIGEMNLMASYLATKSETRITSLNLILLNIIYRCV